MSEIQRHAGNLKLLGGILCLDFVNTVNWRGAKHPREYLCTFQDLVAWKQHVQILSGGEAHRLLVLAVAQPYEAERVLQRAIELRETLFHLFATVSRGIAPAGEDLDTFNLYFAEVMREARLVQSQSGFRLDFHGNTQTMDWILYPIIHSAADLLLSEKIKRVKLCADPSCGWLFLDNSRNRSRRWCDMKDCGNRAKARRYYQQQKTRLS